MGTALAVFHGPFGRASLYRLNKPLAPHAHREGHLVCLVDGAPARTMVDGHPHPVDRDRAVAINPWQPHGFEPTDYGRGAVFLTLYIAPRWFMETTGTGLRAMRFGSATVELDPRTRGLVARVASELGGRDAAQSVGSLIHDLTASAMAASWASAATTAADRPRLSDFRIRNAMRLMNERVTDTCVLDHIARDAGLSRPHFYKLFRENVGVTPNMYLNTLRLERSIDRLARSEDPVTSIGLDLGFASQASFTRFFSNNIGISPTDYRRVSLHAA